MLPVIFSLTLFSSAALMFWVQPLVARLLLPHLGGAPAVWNTCLVFFQAALLAGYLLAHWSATRLKPRTQVALQLALLFAALCSWPIGMRGGDQPLEPWASAPALWLLGQLAIMVGPAFLVLAVTAPLLQRWFALTGHPAARDPYFLYAASNLGSLVALLGFPLWLEPNLRLGEQSRWWMAGLGAQLAWVALCGLRVWRAPTVAAPIEAGDPATSADAEPITWRRRWLWVACAFVPSGWLLGVTNYITTDIASMPLLWVLPLGIYLLTFVLVFAQRQFLSARLLSRALPIGALAVAYQMCAALSEPAWLVTGLHLLVFFIGALVSHGRLAATRPAPVHLTEFYLWMSVGGVLGGLFNALLAPVIFQTIAEYPLVLVLACALRFEGAPPDPRASEAGAASEAPPRPEPSGAWPPNWRDLAGPVGILLLTALLAHQVPPRRWLPATFEPLLIFGVPLLLSFLLVDAPRRFALALAALFLGSTFHTGGYGRTLHVERNFFGVSRVTLSPDGRSRQLVHGRTIHGRQFLDPQRAQEPLTFYHREGPLGDVFAVFQSQGGPRQVGVIGLGAGSMAAYARTNETWTYYDIDPSVIRIAQDTNYFSFLAHSAARRIAIVEGDARLRLRAVPDGNFDLLVLDAFSSDAIPMHLITREAVELYVRKLAPGGLLAFHISNRYLDLEPVLANLAAELGLTGLGYDDNSLTGAEFATGREQAHWVVLAATPEGLAGFRRMVRWPPLHPEPRVGVWTDDFSSPLKVLQW